MTRLYIFEGVPGSGKTTSAKWLKSRLGDKAKLFLEGDAEHPADYESVACLTEDQIDEVEKDFPLIRKLAIPKGERYFISYAGMYEEDKELFERLRQFDVYELAVEDYLIVALDRWREFVQKAKVEGHSYILECCYLQNPFTFLLAKHNCSKEVIFHFLNNVTEIISELDPVVVYFEQENLSDNLKKIRQERPIEWFEFVTWYYTGQEYGKERGLSGESGVLHFLNERKQYEKEFLSNARVKSMIINNTNADWEQIHDQLAFELGLLEK
ncbi:hypothetical protein [Robertmurraya korlensis]|uniref:hypothetical protein n=1 Tax=Robertmurraya korlensis TaxID=519977 RepID=UPI000824E9EE|nr:hypothetical protein [Robertmurraya korlensis]